MPDRLPGFGAIVRSGRGSPPLAVDAVGYVFGTLAILLSIVNTLLLLARFSNLITR